ncbi:DUF4411 family protein [Gelidibacter mesophilus]|uniref:DUF4411 family protein n=1 Tax=Gelidibacter mesophilus TaxID=169050 RepID=UPI0003F958F7|nr:DUF4411 family protein [Gelidibacter mesophilus]
MKVIIDTSSLLSLVRYYLPFDQNTKLYKFIKSEFENGNLILIDAVYEECEYTTQGLVLKSLDYLNEKDFKKTFKLPIKTKDLLPPSTKKFYNLLNDNFRTPLSRRLNEAEFEERKKEFLETADARMIILALIKKNEKEEITIVTEESENGNDSKAFKKIPAICKILDVNVMTLPELLKVYQGIDIEFK